jgi:DNA polymerase (family X)
MNEKINEKISRIFVEIADMLEVQGESVFRIRAYRRAAETVRGLGYDLAELHHAADQAIEDIPGIGKDLHAKIVEIVETGECEMHGRLVGKLGRGILDILRVRGVGPKKVKLFRDQLGIVELTQLEAAAESGALATLPGMGEKSQARILESLSQATHEQRRTPYQEALRVAGDYIAHMKKLESIDKVKYAGSLRRKSETVGDIDLLVTGEESSKINTHFLTYPGIKEVLAAGETKSSVVVEFEGGLIQVDLRVVDKDSWGAALFYFTGPKHYNIDVRTVAMKKDMKINEYGLFRGDEKLAGKTEKEICEALGVPFLQAEDRK